MVTIVNLFPEYSQTYLNNLRQSYLHSKNKLSHIVCLVWVILTYLGIFKIVVLQFNWNIVETQTKEEDWHKSTQYKDKL